MTDREEPIASAGGALFREPERGERWKRRAGVLGLLAAVAAALFLGPQLIESATEIRLGERFAHPGTEHPLGTDDRGRDTMSRMAVALGATGVMLVGLWAIAFVVGSAAGLARGLVPRLVWPAVDAFYRAWECLPMVLLAGALVIVSGSTGASVALLLGAMGAVSVSRRVAEVVTAVTQHDSYRAAAASCVPPAQLLMRYRLPQAWRAGQQGALAFLAPALIWETSLGFLSPDVAVSPWSLGSLIREGSPYFMDAPRLVLIPAGILFGLILVFRFMESASASRLKQSLSLLES